MFEVTNGLARDEHVLGTIELPAQDELNRCSEDTGPRHLKLKWVTTERGLEARWTVHPEEPAHFVLRKGQLVPAALAARW